MLRVVILLYVSSCVSVLGQEDPNSTLKLVHVFFRHGDRTPEKFDDFLHLDLYTKYNFSEYGYGHLTNKGKSRTYSFGQFLRNRYNSFLGNFFYPDLVEATSTDVDRTKNSAQLVLAGLFPPFGSQQWNDDLAWLPIAYKYTPDAYDYTFKRPNSYCPRYLSELEDALNSKEAQQIPVQYRRLYKVVEAKVGKKMSLRNMFRLYQTINSMNNMNLSLPEWTKNIFPEPLRSVGAKQCYFENSNDILQKLNGGRSLQYVMKNIQDKVNGYEPERERKIYLVSGHENNVLNILAALNLFDPPHIPTYSSATLIELHNINDEYGIKIFYFRGVENQLEELTIPGCQQFCPLSEFTELTADIIPVNYTVECESPINLD